MALLTLLPVLWDSATSYSFIRKYFGCVSAHRPQLVQFFLSTKTRLVMQRSFSRCPRGFSFLTCRNQPVTSHSEICDSSPVRRCSKHYIDGRTIERAGRNLAKHKMAPSLPRGFEFEDTTARTIHEHFQLEWIEFLVSGHLDLQTNPPGTSLSL